MRPAGKYQMEDLFYAGGIPAILKQLLPLLHGDALTVTGQALAESVAEAQIYNPDVIRSLDNPLQPEGGLAVLYGNLAPEGAVIKHTAASSNFLQHRGKACVFQNMADLQNGDEIELDVPNRRLHLQVDEAELTRHRAAWQAPAASFQRGYGQLYLQHVTQAPLGCDFDFLQGNDPVEAMEQPKF